ncbi:MAG: preprotein translocase subunit SecA [bacterium]|nr:preprotein translocase subunit SecA [bacterium]
MYNWIIRKIIGSRNQRILKRLWPIVHQINALEEQYQQLSDSALQAKTEEFRDRLAHGATLDDLMVEAFAVVKNACRRLCGASWEICGHPYTWNMIPYDVQMLGAIVLHRGAIAEMATGEGKTLVSVMPLYLNALLGRGAHIVTVNDYLARRDAQWNGPVYRFLGLTVGCIQNQMGPNERRAQYACDITYGTNSEFGFDYLRDHGMAMRKEDMVQRGHYYAIVDEVDSILIDEARTPLIISGPVGYSRAQTYLEIKPLVESLVDKQRQLCNNLLRDARDLLEKGDDDNAYRAGRLMYIVQKGMPKHRQLLKLLEEPRNRKLIDRVHADLIADMRRREMHQILEDLYFAMDERSNEVHLTDKGLAELSPRDKDRFVLPDIVGEMQRIEDDDTLTLNEKAQLKASLQQKYQETSERLHNLSQLLRAYTLFEKDVDYVVQDNRVLIVDEFTGRILPGRRYSDGLHSALEAKEGVKIEAETQTYATITIQNYFRLYEKLAGMTGTAETEAEEFHQIYKLDCVVIPTHKPCIRKDYNDVIYKTRREKYNAVIEEIAACHARGQPVLVGTITVDQSEILSRMLQRRGISHSVLNAKHHEREAEIVAQAGQRGAVTIATNMAGRGTDIKLGPGVAELGGLHIIGTERHESRRIDRQLRGRAGRQGDPGSSRFYVSLEDDLMRLFGSERIARIMERMGMKEGEPLEHPLLNRSIENAQKRVEQRNFGIRKHTLEFDDVMNKQRAIIYNFRARLLQADDIHADVLQFLDDTAGNIVDDFMAQRAEKERFTEEDVREFLAAVLLRFPVRLNPEDVKQRVRDPQALHAYVRDAVFAAYERKCAIEGAENVRRLERFVFLTTIDKYWKDHLYEMDSLRESVYLRSYGQRDPLLEYKKEAHTLFTTMMENLAGEVASNVFALTTVPERVQQLVDLSRASYSYDDLSRAHTPAEALAAEAAIAGARGLSAREMQLHMADVAYSGAGGPARPHTVIRTRPKVGRNEPCPCGSGKKYKHCCGK